MDFFLKLLLSLGILITAMAYSYYKLDLESLSKILIQRSRLKTSDSRFSQEGTKEIASIRDLSFVDFIETKSAINRFNRLVLSPRLKSLMMNDHFRYVRVNVNRPCKLWCNAEKCNLKDCKVKEIGDPSKCPMPIYDDELSSVITQLGDQQIDIVSKFSECYDNDDQDSHYVDLLVNPERYTGYSGESARKVWRAIYEENCFIHQLRSPFDKEMCFEKRLFYEAISGLHSSINIHLCAEYPSNNLIGNFEPNLDEFMRRFGGRNDYLDNLYTLYLLELRALLRSKHYLIKKVNWPNASTKGAVYNLISVMDKNQVPTLKDISLKPDQISHDLATHFQNITTTIMDCVACDKCKLWGKVQLRGLGAAFKVLATNEPSQVHLNHQEIVSLFNAISRLSQSIRHLEDFRDLFLSRHKFI